MRTPIRLAHDSEHVLVVATSDDDRTGGRQEGHPRDAKKICPALPEASFVEKSLADVQAHPR